MNTTGIQYSTRRHRRLALPGPEGAIFQQHPPAQLRRRPRAWLRGGLAAPGVPGGTGPGAAAGCAAATAAAVALSPHPAARAGAADSRVLSPAERRLREQDGQEDGEEDGGSPRPAPPPPPLPAAAPSAGSGRAGRPPRPCARGGSWIRRTLDAQPAGQVGGPLGGRVGGGASALGQSEGRGGHAARRDARGGGEVAGLAFRGPDRAPARGRWGATRPPGACAPGEGLGAKAEVLWLGKLSLPLVERCTGEDSQGGAASPSFETAGLGRFGG